MIKVSANRIIELNRGDTVDTPLYINIGTALEPYYYEMHEAWKEIDEVSIRDYVIYKKENDKYYGYVGDVAYFALLEPNQRWENALIKKTFTALDFNKEEYYVTLHLDPEDTEYLKTKTYYYEVKLYRCVKPGIDDESHIDTVVNRTKFVLVE